MKPKIKPESEWTQDDRICMTSMEAFHGGTWRPAVDGGLVRVSERGSWKNVGEPSQFLRYELMKERIAILGR